MKHFSKKIKSKQRDKRTTNTYNAFILTYNQFETVETNNGKIEIIPESGLKNLPALVL